MVLIFQVLQGDTLDAEMGTPDDADETIIIIMVVDDEVGQVSIEPMFEIFVGMLDEIDESDVVQISSEP